MIPFYDDGTIRLFVGDCLDVMGTLDDKFDLIFTSPPYNLSDKPSGGFQAAQANPAAGRKASMWTAAADGLASGYQDHDDAMPRAEYEAWQTECLRAMWTHLTADGAIFYNHKPRPSGNALWHPRCLVPPELPVRQEIIWARAGGINFGTTHYCPTYEVILVIADKTWRLKSQGASGVGDVWSIPQEIGTQHPAPFPVRLPARAIETTAPGLVLDPFAGSGSTLVAAKAAGVRAVGIEKSEGYAEIAVKRLQQESLFSYTAEQHVQDVLL